MGLVLRTAFAFVGFATVAVLGLLYGEVMKPLVKKGKQGGQFGGPFSDIVSQIDTLIPLLVAALMVIVAIYWIVGGVQDERRVKRRRQP